MRKTNLLPALMLSLSVVSAAAADAAKGKADTRPTKTDRELIQGTWDVVGRVKNGRSEDVKEKPVTLTFTRDSVTEFKAGEKKAVGTFTLDPAKAPRRITMTGKEGAHAGTAFEGIYDLAGDKLKISYGVRDPRTPPNDFSGDEGTGLLVLQRRKDEKQAKADAELIQGSWKVTSFVLGETDFSDTKLKEHPITMRFHGDKMSTNRVDDGSKTEAVVELDPSQKPKHITFIPQDGPEKDSHVQGIYHLAGDTLKLAFPVLDLTVRPPDFTQGDNVVVMTLERQKEQND